MTRLTQNPILGWIDRYRLVAAGLAIVLAISLFGVVGRLFVPRGMADVGAARVAIGWGPINKAGTCWPI